MDKLSIKRLYQQKTRTVEEKKENFEFSLMIIMAVDEVSEIKFSFRPLCKYFETQKL